jgi:hypothetical protein
MQQGLVTMSRFCLVLLVGLWSAGPAPASWAEGMFEEHSRDFGSVPRGPAVSHAFRLTNKTNQHVHIAGVRVSCGCTTATALKNDLAPGESTAILAEMDTRRFAGVKTVTIYVTFDRPRWDEVRLWVQANGRDDVSLTPEALAFGQVKHGSSPVANLNVAFLGNLDWRILEATCDSNYVQTKVEEVRREGGDVTYQVSARIRRDTPVGKWYTDIWLKTNNALTPRVRVPLTIEIESALMVSPSVANLGQIKAGGETERKVIVRGAQPFRITGVQGEDVQLTVKDSSRESKPVHVLTVKLKAVKAGDLSRTFRVQTDLKDEGEVEFQAIGQIIP